MLIIVIAVGQIIRSPNIPKKNILSLEKFQTISFPSMLTTHHLYAVITIILVTATLESVKGDSGAAYSLFIARAFKNAAASPVELECWVIE